MALISCPKCGKQISDKALMCPNCKWTVNLNELKEIENIQPKQQNNSKFKSIYFFQVLFNLLLLIIIIVLICQNNMLRKEKETVNEETVKEIESTDNGYIVVDNEDSEEVEDLKLLEQIMNDPDIEKITEEVEIVDDNISTNNMIEVEYKNCNIDKYRVTLYFTVKNIADKNITVDVEKQQYVNDISINKYLSIINNSIPKGKSAQLELEFQIEKLKHAVDKIDTLDLQLNIDGDIVEFNFNDLDIIF